MGKQFSGLGIRPDLITYLEDLGISTPTPVQERTIPLILNGGNDIVALAKTGTGKTLAFGLPLVQLIDADSSHIQAMILAPTRELGQQIAANLNSLASDIGSVKIASVCGGTSIKSQIEQLSGPNHIVVATPGRLLDLLNRKAIDLGSVEYLILDEADEMVTALKTDLDHIINAMSSKRRTFLFTATMPGAVKQLIQNYLSKNVVTVEADMEIVGNAAIVHKYIVVEPIEKLEILLHFLNTKEGERGIIFCKTKAAVNKLAKKLAINRFSSGAIHGSLTQGIRDRIMAQFREGHIDILVATDLAARGIDVKELSYVVNYHLPNTYDTYVHRSGRTARAGKNGLSLTILQQEEVGEVADFEEALGIKFEESKKTDAQNIDDNNTLLWAKRIFKTKPNRHISEEMKDKVKTVFHHLTKEELVEKILANYMIETNSQTSVTNNK